jgi:ribosomal-protein-alanine acetyltransferase
LFIRAATSADLPDITALATESAPASHGSASHYGEVFSPGSPRRVLLLASEEAGYEPRHKPGTLVGFVLARIVEREWEIENIVVRAPARRRGIATGLLKQICELAKSENAIKILLEVRQSSSAARGLYQKLGFEHCGYRSRYYREPEEDAVLYHLLLQ